jgi:hypothetical protein
VSPNIVPEMMPLRVMIAFPNQKMSMINRTIVKSVRKKGESITVASWIRAVALTAVHSTVVSTES